MKPPLEIVTSNSSKINASVIWLHGLGADGYDFESIVHELKLPNVRFILPHAPEMAITRNSGYIMPAWYDVYGLTPISKEDESGIRASQNYINTLIQLEIDKGIPAEQIVLAGFSQGGALALHTALRYPKKLAGVLALSCYLPLKSTLVAEANSANAKLPIFMAHGIFDEVITIESAKVSLATLQSSQYLVNWHEYNMAHSLCAQEISDIRDFLQRVLQQDLVE
ncbi:MAG: alpha/beta fold hydrolase [Methylotenera sp.]